MISLLTGPRVSRPARHRRLPQLPSRPVLHSPLPWRQHNQRPLKKRPTALSEVSLQLTFHLQSDHTGLSQSPRRSTCGLSDLLLAMDLPAWKCTHNSESMLPSRRKLLPELSMMMMSTPLKRKWMRVPLMMMSPIGIPSATACPPATNSETCSSVWKSWLNQSFHHVAPSSLLFFANLAVLPPLPTLDRDRHLFCDQEPLLPKALQLHLPHPQPHSWVVLR